MKDDSIWLRSAKPTEFLFTVFMRFVAVSCFYFGLHYWAMLIGYTDNGAMRFDLMSSQWRTVATCLAVLYPVAALGLWSGVSWGVVLWAAAAGYETLIHAFWYLIYGRNDLLIIMHLTVAAVFVIFIAVIWYQRRVANRAVTLDSL
ncbi:DUF6163 family protein [Rhizobium sp. L1K21]|uniref:DUF6163 family protein n=1 Tax=Rhizobium sp. L1K21 TaxID=2954933 RepID=UPI002091FD7C|nr:DUF6163 family protein [Rhizobium sp. L1K21]MCO6185816.1 DUF6163 family protein [Rhizobium sp. L1K21]